MPASGALLPPPPAHIREIKWLRIWLSLAGLLLFVVAAVAWRQYQIQNTRDRLLALADAHVAAHEDAAAVKLYREALGLFPKRGDVLWKLTLAFDREAKNVSQKQQAVELYRRSAAAASDYRQDARLRMAELLWDIGSGEEALALANGALDTSPHNARAWRVKGLTLAHRHDAQDKVAPAELLESLETAQKLNPHDLPLAAGLAGWLRRSSDAAAAEKNAARADQVMDQFVALHADAPPAYLARFAYRTHFALPEADKDLDAALRLSPDNDEIVLAAGQQFRKEKQWRAAKALYERLVKLKPNDARGHLGLALTYSSQRDLDGALKAANQGMADCPHDPWLIVQACGWNLDKGDPAEADRLLDRVESQWNQIKALLPPHQIKALEQSCELLKIRKLIRENKLNTAVDRLRTLSAYHESQDILPEVMVRRLQIHGMLAHCLVQQLDWYGAAEQFDALAKLEPNNAQRLVQAGRTWLKAHQPLRASQRLERALSIDPNLEGVAEELRALQRAAPK